MNIDTLLQYLDNKIHSRSGPKMERAKDEGMMSSMKSAMIVIRNVKLLHFLLDVA